MPADFGIRVPMAINLNNLALIPLLLAFFQLSIGKNISMSIFFITFCHLIGLLSSLGYTFKTISGPKKPPLRPKGLLRNLRVLCKAF